MIVPATALEIKEWLLCWNLGSENYQSIDVVPDEYTLISQEFINFCDHFNIDPKLLQRETKEQPVHIIFFDGPQKPRAFPFYPEISYMRLPSNISLEELQILRYKGPCFINKSTRRDRRTLLDDFSPLLDALTGLPQLYAEPNNKLLPCETDDIVMTNARKSHKQDQQNIQGNKRSKRI